MVGRDSLPTDYGVFMKELISLLLDDVREYYERNERPHDLCHVKEVMADVDKLSKLVKLRDNYHRAALVAAAWHDAFDHVDRKRHHSLASEHLIRNSESMMVRYDLDADAMESAWFACLEHRASWEGAFTTMVSEVVSAADRGRPNLKSMLLKAFEYSKNKLGLSDDEAKERACEHMHEKFGSEGYARYPRFYQELYASEIDAVQLEIKSLPTTIEAFDNYTT